MGAVEAVVELVRAFVWPATLLLVLYLFRNEVSSLLPNLRKASAGKWALEFDTAVKQVSDRVEQLADELGPRGGTNPALAQLPLSNRYAENQSDAVDVREWVELAGEAPRGAVLAAWARLAQEARVTSVAVAKAIGDERLEHSTITRSPARIAEELASRGLIPDSAFHTIHQLAELRNRAAHATDAEISPAVAMEYAQAARDLDRLLRGAVLNAFASGGTEPSDPQR